MRNCVLGRHRRSVGCTDRHAAGRSGITTKGGGKMSNTWLAAESFERGQRLIQATNTLAISVKLTLAGKQDPERATLAEHAREELRTFLGDFASWLAEAERAPARQAPALDPRFHHLLLF